MDTTIHEMVEGGGCFPRPAGFRALGRWRRPGTFFPVLVGEFIPGGPLVALDGTGSMRTVPPSARGGLQPIEDGDRRTDV